MSKFIDEEYSHSISDGVLEILGITSSFHIAQLQVGLNKPIRLGQGRTVKVCVIENSIWLRLIILILHMYFR